MNEAPMPDLSKIVEAVKQEAPPQPSAETNKPVASASAEGSGLLPEELVLAQLEAGQPQKPEAGVAAETDRNIIESKAATTEIKWKEEPGKEEPGTGIKWKEEPSQPTGEEPPKGPESGPKPVSPENPEPGKPETGPENKEKSAKEILEAKLGEARDVCAKALYEKDKAGAEIDKKEHSLKRFFVGSATKEKWRGANEDYIKRGEIYKKTQEDYKAVLKEYRLLSLGEKRKELEKNREEALKKLIGDKKIPEEILSKARIEDVGLIKGHENDENVKKKSEEYKQAEKNRDDFIAYLMEEQGVTDKDVAKKMYEDVAYGNLRFSKEGIEQQMEKNAKEIAVGTTLKEATELYNLKEHKRIEDLGEQGKWIKEYALKGAQWYRQQKWYKKVGLGVGFAGASMAAGAIGGATGAALLSGILVGKVAQRILGGAATAIGTETLIKGKQEKAARKEIEKSIGEKYLEMFKNDSSKLDEKLFEISSRKGSEEKRRYILAGTMGVLVGSGAVAEAVRNGLDWIPDSIKESLKQGKGWVFEKLGFEKLGGVPKPTVKPETGKIYDFNEYPYGAVGSQPSPDIGGPKMMGGVGEAYDNLVGSKYTDLVGGRGPQGNIIDYLKSHPGVAAEKFGWDGKTPIGIKASEVWDKFAAGEIKKPEIKALLLEKGYSADPEGYAKMMHRIGKGAIEIDPQSGSVKLVDASFLKAPAVPVEGPTYADVSQAPKGSAIPYGAGPPAEIPVQAETPGKPQILSESEARALREGKHYGTNLPEAPKVVSKNFVSGAQYESMLREQVGVEKLLDKEGLFNKETIAQITGRVDKLISGTMNMDSATYASIKDINLEQFINAKPSTLAQQLEWPPAKNVVDAYLRENKYLDPNDLKGSVGDFFKKIIKVDVGEMPQSSGGVSIGALERLAESAVGERPVIANAENVIASIKSNSLTAEDFGKYYNKMQNLEPLSEESEGKLSEIFKAIKGADPKEQILAENALKDRLERLQALAEESQSAKAEVIYPKIPFEGEAGVRPPKIEMGKEIIAETPATGQPIQEALPAGKPYTETVVGDKSSGSYKVLRSFEAAPVNQQVKAFTEAFKEGNLSAEDFGKYYFEKLGVPQSANPQLAENISKTVEDIKSTDIIKRDAAVRRLTTLLRNINKK